MGILAGWQERLPGLHHIATPTLEMAPPPRNLHSAPFCPLHLLALTVLESAEAQQGQDNLIMMSVCGFQESETVQRFPTRVQRVQLLKISATTMTIQSQVRPFQDKYRLSESLNASASASSPGRLRRGFDRIEADARALIHRGRKVVPSLSHPAHA